MLALHEVPAEGTGRGPLRLPAAPQRAQGFALQALQLREPQLVQHLVDPSHCSHLETEGEGTLKFPSHPGDDFATSGVTIPGIPPIPVPPPSAPPACPQPQFIHFLSLFLALGSAITGFVGFGTLLPKSYNGALFLLKTRGLCSGKGRPRGQRLLVSTGWVFFPPLQQTEGS